MHYRKPLVTSAAILLLVCVAGGLALLKPQKTGQNMVQEALQFLDSLSEEQRKAALADLEDPKRLDWHFIPKPQRKGVQLRDMNDAQRKAAHELLRSTLSQVGYEKSKVIMDLEKILFKLEGEGARFKRDYLKYYFTIFGRPTLEGKWGLSIEGHHLSLNFVVDKGVVTSHTPAFYGANPGLVMADYGVGIKKGTRVLSKEELLAFNLLNSLDKTQREQAVIAAKAPRDLRGGGEPQPPDTAAEGLAAAKMTPKQVETLRSLIKSYTENMAAETAERRWREIEEAGVDNIHFAWAGPNREGVGHYYRLQGPSFLVEFCNTQPDAAGNPANHIHAMWRDTAGDFGVPR